MDDSESSGGLASLQAARAELEAALRTNPDWLALHTELDETARAEHEQQLAGNARYKSWRLVNEAIEHLRATDGAAGVTQGLGVADETDQVEEQVAPVARAGDDTDDPRPEARASGDLEAHPIEDETHAAPRVIRMAPMADTEMAAPRQTERVGADGILGAHADRSEAAPQAVAAAQEPHGALTDNLTLIQGIDDNIAQDLHSLGVTSFSAIANWRRDDVQAVAEALGLTREISQQNWIEQAALLERRKREDQPADTKAALAATVTEAAEEPPVREAIQSPARESDRKVSAPEREIDLPDIIKAIRNDASVRDSEPLAVALDTPVDEPPGPPAEDVIPAADVEEAAASPPTMAVEPALASPPKSETVFQPRARIPIVGASEHVNTDAAERVRRLAEQRLRAQRLADAGGVPSEVETEEAAVTFIIREPLRPDAAEPTDGPRSQAARPQPDEGRERGRYVPPQTGNEEAEVVVVTPDGSYPALPEDTERPVDKRSGRRFLRMLSRG